MNFETFMPIALEIAGGLQATLGYTITACFFGFWLALIFAIIRFYKLPFAFLITFFVSIIRGTPLMLQVFFFYFCLPKLGFSIPGQISAVLAFIFNSAAYTSEILRGGFLAINQGQFLACKTLGIPTSLMWKDIIAPQLLRVCLPGLVSEFTSLMKDTSILSIIGEDDVMKRVNGIGSSTYSYLVPLMIAGSYYYLISSAMSILSTFLEKRMNYNVKD